MHVGFLEYFPGFWFVRHLLIVCWNSNASLQNAKNELKKIVQILALEFNIEYLGKVKLAIGTVLNA